MSFLSSTFCTHTAALPCTTCRSLAASSPANPKPLPPVLLPATPPAAVDKVPQPRELFHALHQAFLCAADPATQDPLLLAARRAAAATAAATTTSAAATSDAPAASDSTAAADEAAAAADQELCARAMAAVYHAHAGAIGPVEGIAHLLLVLDLTPRRPLRHALLELVQALLAPRSVPASNPHNTSSSSSSSSDSSSGGVGASSPGARAVRANSYAFMEAGGLELLVDLVAYAHTGGSVVEGGGAAAGEAGGRRGPGEAAGLAAGGPGSRAGLMLTSVGHDEMPKEWYCYPHGVVELAVGGGKLQEGGKADAADSLADLLGDLQPSGEGIGGDQHVTEQQKQQEKQQQEALLGRKVDETGRAGPYTRDEVRQMVSRGSVGQRTLVWAAGMGRPEPLCAVRELRWMLARGAFLVVGQS